MSPRTVHLPAFTVYSYDELSAKAKEKAREEIVTALTELGKVTDMLRAEAADFLTNEGWTDLAELRWDDNGPDLDRLQFSIAHVQGDFVVWGSSRPWTFLDTELRVETKIAVMWQPVMDITVWQGEDEIDNEHVRSGARSMVRDQQARALAIMHKTDAELAEDEDYLADFAVANDMEFREDGTSYVE